MISKLLLSILLIAVITVFINSTPNAFAQTTIDFSSGAYSSTAPGGFPSDVNTYTESGYTFQTPLVFRQHFDSDIGTGALRWHESGANTVDNVILSGFGGSTFNLLSFDVVSSSSTLTLTGSNGQTFVVPSGSTGIFTPDILGVTSVTWDLAGSAFRDSVVIDNVIVLNLLSTGGGGPAEPPTIGMNMAGTELLVTCGVAFDGKCFTITALFHEEFKLYEMMSGTHTISITMYCVNGVNTCNYAAIGIMPYSESMDNTTWKIELYKDFEGNVTPVTTDPEGFLGTVTVTTQIIDDTFWIVSFTVDFKNKDTGPMMFGVQARDDRNAVRNWYLNEGVEFKDSDAYPSIETEFEKSLDVEPLCLNEDPYYRYSCAFAKKVQLEIERAEKLLT